MGNSCVIKLPQNVRLDNVTDVLGRLAGLPVEKMDLERTKLWSALVRGISTKTFDDAPTMVSIMFAGKYCTYHFEGDNCITILADASPFWMAAAHRLADFFGGSIDHNDCDDIDVDYWIPAKSSDLNRPSDGAPWQLLQQRIYDILPLSRTEIETYDFARYRDDNLKYGADDRLVAEVKP